MESAAKTPTGLFCLEFFHFEAEVENTTLYDTQFYPSLSCAFYPDRTYPLGLLRFVRTDGWLFNPYRTRTGLPPVCFDEKPVMGRNARESFLRDESNNSRCKGRVGVRGNRDRKVSLAFNAHGKRTIGTAIYFSRNGPPTNVGISSLLERRAAQGYMGATTRTY